MIALGIKPGDEVIVPAMSWISTSETVSQAGGKIVFCDIRDDSYTLDESKIENLITDRTVGIIPVHLYGHPANMKEIGAIAKKHGLWVIEDCAYMMTRWDKLPISKRLSRLVMCCIRIIFTWSNPKNGPS